MDVFEAPDNSTTEIVNFELDWLPAAAYEYVTPRVVKAGQGKTVHVKVGPYVGAIPLKGDRVLYLTPRVGRRMFSRMLVVSEGLANSVGAEFDELAQIAYDQGDGSWMQLLKRPYAAKLRQIEKESLMPERRRRRDQLGFVRGHLEVLPTLKSVARREPRPVHCRYSEKTFETAENRMLSAAAAQLLNLGVASSTEAPALARWANCSDRRLSFADFQQVVNGLISGRYTGPRAYYIPALVMARLILAQGNIQFDHTELVEAEALVTNMDLLFERYTRRTISRALSPQGLTVKKVAGSSQAPSLFLDGTCTMEPDILVSDAKGDQLVIDVKYKPDAHRIESSDYYQLATYLDAFDCDTGMLILPSRHEESLNRRRTLEGKVVYELRVPMQDYSETERSLSEKVLTPLNS